MRRTRFRFGSEERSNWFNIS